MRSLTLLLLAGLAYASPHSSHCRCRPHQSCWPSPQDWSALNRSIDGNLVAVQPVASVCHGDPNNAACKTVTDHWTNSTWRAAQPGAVLWENWEAWPERNQSCYIEDIPNGPCEQGRISLFSAVVQSASHIQKAVRFARNNNLRLAIKNSGHDYLGRSAAGDSLQILTNRLRDIKFLDNFTPAGAPSGKSEGSAVTIAAGVSLQELYTAVGAKNRTVVAGAAHTVGAAGGYIQGGGHSFLGPWKGMAADNALEFTVVTARGNLVTANAYQNQDLFWALRGGGGGTFGVVVSVTLRTFDEAPVVVANFNITSLADNPHFWDAMAHFHRTAPSLNDAAGGGYYFLTPNIPVNQNTSVSSLISMMAFPDQTDTAQVDRLYRPLLAQLNRTTGVQAQYISLALPSVDSLIWNFLLQGSDADEAGTISVLGSRLFSRDLLASADGAARLSATMQKFDWTPGRTFIGHLVAGGAVAKNAAVDAALHPAWRKTALHLVFGRDWAPNATLAEQLAVRQHLTQVEVPLLRSVEGPHAMGAYVNEANAYETDFQASFWGANYDRLYRVKQRWDPTGLFLTRRGVGSEDWDEEGLCRRR